MSYGDPHLIAYILIQLEKNPDTDANIDPLTASATSAMQCKLLVTWFAVFNGDLTQQGISELGFWAAVRYGCSRRIIDVLLILSTAVSIS